jgi:tRNA threonylcarbamoyladenosine biosynthesis protein TsaE
MVVLLSGDLGAGKTCFAQGVADGMGVSTESPVTSPSYTLLNIHHGRLPLYHFDLYRLSQVDDLEDLGYDEFAGGDGLTLVEWADRMAGSLSASVAVSIDHLDEQKRGFRFDALDGRGKKLLEQLAGKWPLSS